MSEAVDVTADPSPAPAEPSQQPEQQTTEAWFKARGGEVAEPEARNGEPAPPEKPSVSPDSDPGKAASQEQKKDTSRDDHWRELLSQQGRQYKERIAALEAQVNGNGVTRTSPPEPAKEPAAGKPVAPVEDNYNDWASYKAAEREYFEALADWKAEQKLADFRKQSGEAAERLFQKQQQNRAAQQYAAIEQAAAKEFPDYAQKADAAEQAIAAVVQGGATDGIRAVIEYVTDLSNPDAGKVLYRLGATPERIQEIAAMPYFQAVVALSALNDSPGSAPVVNKATAAPPPPTQLSTGKSGPVDELAEALKSGDFRRYKQLADAQERQARKAS